MKKIKYFLIVLLLTVSCDLREHEEQNKPSFYNNRPLTNSVDQNQSNKSVINITKSKAVQKIKIGMTSEQVIKNAGKPSHTHISFDNKILWVYECCSYPDDRTKIYFKKFSNYSELEIMFKNNKVVHINEY